MRRRVLFMIVGVTALTLAVATLLLTVLLRSLVDQSWQSRTDDLAKVAAGLAAEYDSLGSELSSSGLSALVGETAQVVVRLPSGETLATGPIPTQGHFRSTASVDGVEATVAIPRSRADARYGSIALLVWLCSSAAFGVGLVGAWLYSRRLVRPLDQLAANAEQLATGDLRRVGDRYGIPELDAIAEVIDRAVMSFNDLLEGERRLTADASHQLRTPLTALSLRLEEIIGAGDLTAAQHEATQALDQVERLAGVSDHLVAVARGARAPVMTPFEVDRLVRAARAEWEPLYQASRRRLVHVGTTGLSALGSYGAQSQVLATLLENSLRHGAGTTTVRTRAVGDWVVIEVHDEGAGVPPELAPRVFERHVTGDPDSGNGLGLTLARTLAAADGGRLQLVNGQPPLFALFLRAGPAGTTADGEDDGAGHYTASNRRRWRRVQPVETGVLPSPAGSSEAAGATAGNTHLR